MVPLSSITTTRRAITLRCGCYSFGPVFAGLTPRVELEAGYGTASIDTHTINGVEIDSADSFGDVRTYQGYVNGYFDLDLGAMFGTAGPLSAITPYLGGGVGFANVELKKQGVSATGVVMDDDDTAFAYHLDAGIGIRLDHLGLSTSLFENTTFEVGYRYTDVSGVNLTARDGTESDTDYTSNMVTFGLRRQF